MPGVASAAPVVQAPLPLPVTPPPTGGPPADEPLRAGGFHESSYELQHGLQVSESEWSDEMSSPAPQGAH